MLTLQIFFLAVWSWPPSGEWQNNGSRGGHLITPSSLLAVHWSSWGGSAQRSPAAIIQPVILGWKQILCCWGRQSRGLRSAVGSENQWSRTTVGTGVGKRIKIVGSMVACRWGPPVVQHATHTYATQWVRVGWPLGACWQATSAMFVGNTWWISMKWSTCMWVTTRSVRQYIIQNGWQFKCTFCLLKNNWILNNRVLKEDIYWVYSISRAASLVECQMKLQAW